MSPSELIEAGERLYGSKWRKPLAEALGVDISTLRRWTTADRTMPKVAAMAVKLMLERKNR